MNHESKVNSTLSQLCDLLIPFHREVLIISVTENKNFFWFLLHFWGFVLVN